MKTFIKPTLIAVIMGLSANAMAVQKDITVTANVDATLDLTTETGAVLPSTLTMGYRPGVGLEPVTQQTKIFTNDATKDIKISLAGPAQLTDTVGAKPGVPLTVKFGNVPLGTAPATIPAALLFPNGESENGSIIQPLFISQETQKTIASAHYSGIVSIVLTQATE